MQYSKSSMGISAFVLLFAVSATAQAQSTPETNAPDSEKGSFSVLFENDIFDNTDHDYTNGVELGYTTAPDDTPHWAVDAARSLPFFAQTGDVRTRYAIGQAIFTPTNLSLANPPLTDRPYAGFLYGSMGLIADDGVHLDQLQVTLGVIGPDSLAEESQNFVHSIINDKQAMGWNTQLHNEPGLVISYERAVKVIAPQSLLGGVFDIEPHFGGAIGNVYDYANAGVMARFGFNLPKDYGPLRIQPSLPGSDYFEPTAGFGAYVFAGVDGRAIARNLFLDGNSFEASRSVSKKDLVGDLALGGALTFDSFRLAFTHVIRTREYATQSTPDRFGAVDLTVRF
ncbi:MAG TPA: lipid A deacylase LpxR family protein [Rhizomicrobium sp.]